jgi:hypothetical protein
MTNIQMWWLSLGLFAVVVVVVAVLLGLIIATAKSIDRNAAGIWTVGKQIAGNTVSIWMLESADRALYQLTTAVTKLQRTTADLHATLKARS